MNELHPILESIWTELRDGVVNRHHGFHLPVLSNTDEAGGPLARVVVLRLVDVEDRILQCHTDRRAPKVAAVRRDPRVHWLFYDYERRLQLRVGAIAEVCTEGAAFEAAWSSSSLDSRRCYLAPQVPGEESPVASANLPEAHLRRAPDPETSEAGRANFAVIRSRVESIDWLHLASGGHRRARFRFTDRGGCSSTWLEP
ncbi:MAG: pyridoxamine 5'-phosphate oxidase family protein [Planctomycetota bacterium]|nr:pyridoxamine 5'-phosphate oxidase family protein [Planctomycetota bacterium]MEE2681418.1 pyridoxamine 5'-phosphate oxidase family protein [Planctomycetota bacterium]